MDDPFAISKTFTPFSAISNIPKLVITEFTTFFPVKGREHALETYFPLFYSYGP